MELLIVGVLGVLAIAAATAFGPRIGIATPLLLVILGIGVSLIPAFPGIDIDPEWILVGVLPPLLYSSSVAMPTMNFRREFGAIGGLSVVLVIVSSLLLGVLFHLMIPGLPLAWGIALGAIVSPTDAVATSIIKKVGVSPRAVAILEGESLLNDATALVTLKAAISAVAFGFSFGGAIGSFFYSVVIAVAIGWAAGALNLWVRKHVRDANVNTAISFAVPFVASIPAELLQASGLVSAVVAGLVTGTLAPRLLSPQHRLTDSTNWRTVEIVLEGALFLVTGLQMTGLAADLGDESTGILGAIGIAAAALLVTIVIRAGYVGLLLGLLHRRSKRGASMKEQLQSMQARLDSGRALSWNESRRLDELEVSASASGDAEDTERVRRLQRAQEEHERRQQDRTRIDAEARRREKGRERRRTRPRPELDEGAIGRMRKRVVRGLADIEYFLQAPLGWKEGSIIVWAGMRGAVTLAAAETLPSGGDAPPHRALLVFVAFLVAAGSLLIQGGTIGRLVRLLKPATPDPDIALAERTRLFEMMRETANAELDGADPSTLDRDGRLRILTAQRNALLDARDDGTFSADMLGYVLEALDADEIAISMRGGPGT
jgi:CPA1 family monovalent cation:H+ antiporter